MCLIHDGFHARVEEIAAASDPVPALWTILELTEALFHREESELFLLGPKLLVRMGSGG